MCPQYSVTYGVVKVEEVLVNDLWLTQYIV